MFNIFSRRNAGTESPAVGAKNVERRRSSSHAAKHRLPTRPTPEARPCQPLSTASRHHTPPRTAPRAAPFLQQVSEEKVSLAPDLADDVKGEGEDGGEGDGVASPKPRLSRGVSESVGVRRRRSVSGRGEGARFSIPRSAVRRI